MIVRALRRGLAAAFVAAWRAGEWWYGQMVDGVEGDPPKPPRQCTCDRCLAVRRCDHGKRIDERCAECTPQGFERGRHDNGSSGRFGG